MLYSILIGIDVLIAAALIGLVLIQRGKGADAGAAFGSGASGTVFGARGSATFLTKATAMLATAFFLVTLGLAYLASHRNDSSDSVISVVEKSEAAKTDGPVNTMEDAQSTPADTENGVKQAPEETAGEMNQNAESPESAASQQSGDSDASTGSEPAEIPQ